MCGYLFFKSNIPIMNTEEKLTSLHLLMKELNKTEWGKLISNVLFEKNKIKKPLDVKVSTTSDGEWFSFDITCHSDRTLLKLAEQCNFPRGFTVVISSDGTKSGMATFYPKFDNDSRNREGESINDGCDRIVVTNKGNSIESRNSFYMGFRNTIADLL